MGRQNSVGIVVPRYPQPPQKQILVCTENSDFTEKQAMYFISILDSDSTVHKTQNEGLN